MTETHPRRRRQLGWGLVVTLLAFVVPAIGAAQHIPTEDELQRKLNPELRDDDRDYQDRSVETVSAKARRAASWVKQKLARLYITPARIALALGLLGALYTRNRNKRLARWLTLAVASYALLVIGVIGVIVGR